MSLYEPKEAQRRYPFLDAATIRYAYYTKAGGALLCQSIARDLGQWLKEKGATIRLNSQVATIDETGTVTLGDGTRVIADRIIVAAGAWVLDSCLSLPRRSSSTAPPLPISHRLPISLQPGLTPPRILDIGGKAEAYMLPPVEGTGLKVGAGVHKRPADDPDANRLPIPGEGESLRKLLSPPLARIDEYRVARVVTCAYTFAPDEKFLSYRKGKALIISACSGHGYKFGAASDAASPPPLKQGMIRPCLPGSGRKPST